MLLPPRAFLYYICKGFTCWILRCSIIAEIGRHLIKWIMCLCRQTVNTKILLLVQSYQQIDEPPRRVDHPQVECMHSDHVCINLQCFDVHQLLTMCWINSLEPQVVCIAIIRCCSRSSGGEIQGNVDSLLLSPLMQSSALSIPGSNTSSLLHSCIVSSPCLWGHSPYPCI